MQKLVWKNTIGDEINLTSGNYGITEWEGFSNTSLNIQSQQVPFQDGGVFLDALMEQRELSVTLAVNDGGNLETRYRLRRELIHALNPKLGEGYLIYTNDFISKRIKCVAQIPLFETHNSNTSGTPKASLSWTACEPYWEDLTEDAKSITLGELAIIDNEGDIETQVQITITGNATDPTIENLDTNKKIGYSGSVNGKIDISTLQGQKSIKETKLSFSLVDGLKQLNDIAYIKGVIYIVGYNGILLKSRDFVNFEAISINTSATLYKIKYFEGKGFFIIGASGTILRSTDGEVWNLVTTNTNENFYDIDTNGTKLIIATFGGVWVSTDGDSWARVSVGNYDFRRIAYGNGVFVLMGSAWYVSTNDGVSWTQQNVQSVNDLKFFNGYFIAVGNNGLVYIFTDGTLNTLSANGIGTTETLYRITYDGIQYIISSYTNRTNFFTNPTAVTGVNWAKTETNVIGNMTAFLSIYEMGLYVSVGSGGSKYKSINLQNWETVTKGMSINMTLFSCAYSEKLNKYVICGTYDYRGYIGVSSDKRDWEVIRAPMEYVRKVIWHRELQMFILCADAILYSYDGLNWEFTNISGQGIMNDCIIVDNQIISCNQGGTIIATSTDGINYTKITTDLPSGVYITKMCYNENNSTYYLVRNNNVYKSTNLENWELAYTVSSGAINNIIYNPIFKIIIAVGNVIIRSSDGENWLEITNPLTSSLYGIAFSEEMNIFIAGGSAGIITSADGRNWEINKTGISVSEIDYIKANKEILTVGASNSIGESLYYEVNKIMNMQTDSDIGFFLKIGTNRILLSCEEGRFQTIIKYKQKYIGV